MLSRTLLEDVPTIMVLIAPTTMVLTMELIVPTTMVLILLEDTILLMLDIMLRADLVLARQWL